MIKVRIDIDKFEVVQYIYKKHILLYMFHIGILIFFIYSTLNLITFESHTLQWSFAEIK